MFNEKYYKPSNNFSFVGFLLTIISVTVVGMALSFVYLKFNAICPIVYLCVLIALGFGALQGIVAGVLIKVFKIRNTSMVILALAIGLLLTTYFKWSLYDYNDRVDTGEIVENYKEEDIDFYLNDYSTANAKTTNALTYFFFDMDEEELAEATADDLVEKYNNFNMTVSKYSAANAVDISSYFVSYDYSPTDTIWYLMGYEDYFGNTESVIRKSFEKAKTMTAYDYVNDYLVEDVVEDILEEYGIKSSKSLGEILTSPSMLIEDIKDINEQGRWSYSSRPRYSSVEDTKDTNTVNGILLWIVWFGELLCINIPAFLVAVAKVRKPFIESDDEWAIKEKNIFKFQNDIPAKVKGSMEIDPMNLFVSQPLTFTPKGASFIAVTLFHSKNYNENYVVVSQSQYNAKKKQYNYTEFIKYMTVSPEFVGTLYTVNGLNPPYGCTASNAYAGTANMGDAYGQSQPQYAQQTTAEPQQTAQPQYAQQTQATSYSTGTVDADAIFGTPVQHKAKSSTNLMTGTEQSEQTQPQAPSDTTNGEMDGLDTSSINLDDMYK